MVPYDASRAFELAASVGLWQAELARHGRFPAKVPAVPPEKDEGTIIERLIADLRSFASRNELSCASRVSRDADTFSRDAVQAPPSQFFRELSAAFADALRDERIWRLTMRERQLFHEPLDAELAATLAPATKDDLEEAARCYATGRYTASGFHSMRVVERRSRQLLSRAGLDPNGFYISVDAILKAIVTKVEESEALAKAKKKPPLAGKERDWLRGVVSILGTYSIGWRNPICHYRDCSVGEAFDLFNVTMALVRQLSSEERALEPREPTIPES